MSAEVREERHIVTSTIWVESVRLKQPLECGELDRSTDGYVRLV